MAGVLPQLYAERAVAQGVGPWLIATDTTCPTAAAPTPVIEYAYDDLDRLRQVRANLPAAEGGNRVT